MCSSDLSDKDSVDFQGTVVKVVDSLENSGSTCISDGNKTSGIEISGFYCRKEETIYIVAGYTGDIGSDLAILFHELRLKKGFFNYAIYTVNYGILYISF